VPSDVEGTESEASITSLWLSIGPGEPPTGLVGRQDDDQGTSFCGWLDFMAVVNMLRAQPRSD
jgi:hypothetical protein